MQTIAARMIEATASSFRDPAGYVYRENGVYKRMITRHGEADYRRLMSSGLYDRLVRDGLLVAHTEEPVPADMPEICSVIVPQQIRHVSYSYEWSFGQLRDAALLTLDVERIALEYGMSLKDASAFNVQFRGSRPIFVDTLSFCDNDGGPWPAYSQFCRHFVAPLLLMSRIHPAFNQYLKTSLDGIPLDLVSALLPRSTFVNFNILVHIHLHSRSQKKYADVNTPALRRQLARPSSDPKPGFVDSLYRMVKSIRPGRFHTEWIRYYSTATHYSSVAENSKKQIVGAVLDGVKPSSVYDLGGNVGEYSRVATARGIDCVCYDIDPMCVHHNYERARSEKDEHILPLLMDLSNPTPSLGFDLKERYSLFERPRADLLLALALIHHLRITANAPFTHIARFLWRLGRQLLIEYVPKSDSMAQVLLRSRPDTFFDYTEEGFRAAFERHFHVQEIYPIADSPRKLYLFAAKA